MAAAAEITMVKTRMRMPSDSSRVNGKKVREKVLYFFSVGEEKVL